MVIKSTELTGWAKEVVWSSMLNLNVFARDKQFEVLAIKVGESV